MANSGFSDATAVGQQPAVLGTGLLALDMIFSPKPDSEPMFAAGGTCGNVLAAMSFLGWEAFPVARLNGDGASRLLRKDLGRWKVRLELVHQEPSAATPIIVHRIRQDSSHGFRLTCPECGNWLPSFRPVTARAATELAKRLLEPARRPPLPRVFFFDRASRAALLLARACLANGAIVAFEPSSIGDQRLFDEALSISHILKYSREQLPHLARRRYPANGPILEIETMGSKGLRYRAPSLSVARWCHLSPISVPFVVDTAGAGDWCTAALLVKLGARGISGLRRVTKRKLDDALGFAQAVAALACAYMGARGLMYALDPSDLPEIVEALTREERVSNDEPILNRRKRRMSRRSVAEVCPNCR